MTLLNKISAVASRIRNFNPICKPCRIAHNLEGRRPDMRIYYEDRLILIMDGLPERKYPDTEYYIVAWLKRHSATALPWEKAHIERKLKGLARALSRPDFTIMTTMNEFPGHYHSKLIVKRTNNE